jgi:HK97 gp10 family phage protein
MLAAKLVGHVLGNHLDKKYLGGNYARYSEMLDRGRFYYALYKALRTAIRDNGKELADDVAEEIRQEVPVDTGELRDSVRVEEGEETSEIHVGGTPETMKPITAGGPNTFDQALGIEYGTSKRPAKPYFWPVLRRNEKKIEKSLGEEIEEQFS